MSHEWPRLLYSGNKIWRSTHVWAINGTAIRLWTLQPGPLGVSLAPVPDMDIYCDRTSSDALELGSDFVDTLSALSARLLKVQVFPAAWPGDGRKAFRLFMVIFACPVPGRFANPQPPQPTFSTAASMAASGTPVASRSMSMLSAISPGSGSECSPGAYSLGNTSGPDSPDVIGAPPTPPTGAAGVEAEEAPLPDYTDKIKRTFIQGYDFWAPMVATLALLQQGRLLEIDINVRLHAPPRSAIHERADRCISAAPACAETRSLAPKPILA